MAENTIELQSSMTGLAYSPEFEKEDDGEVNVIYSAERCVSAWLEYTTDEKAFEGDGIVKKVPIVPTTSSAHSKIPKGAKYRVAGSIGRGGFLRARLVE